MNPFKKADHPASYYFKEEYHECPTCGDRFYKGPARMTTCSCGRMDIDITDIYVRSGDGFREFAKDLPDLDYNFNFK